MMIRSAILTKQEKKDLDKIALANFHVALDERSGFLCEVCFRATDLVDHHIEGRKVPRKAWPEALQEDWPHSELNGIKVCDGAHGSGDRAGRVHAALRHNAPALWALLKAKYPKRIYNGKTYEEWFEGPGPWERYLR